MEFIIKRKTNIIPSFNHNTTVVKNIECASYGEQYNEDEITPDLIGKILNDVPKGIEVSLCLDPDGELCDICLEVVSVFVTEVHFMYAAKFWVLFMYPVY